MTLEIALLMASTALSLAAVTLLALVLLRRKRETFREAAAAQQLDRSIALLDERVHAANVLTTEELGPITHALERLRSGIEGLARVVDRAVSRPAPPANDPVALEHEILGESWRQFRTNRELSAVLDDALRDRAWTQLIDQLKDVVPADLKPTFDTVTGPCREHRAFLQKIELIPLIASGTFPRLATNAEEMRRTRELVSLLSSDSATRLDFRFKSWVTDTFLPFADLYLQRCQQVDLDNGGNELQTGASLVRQVLRIAAVEPIEVTPGETRFDSTRHIGRSTTNDPRYSDGVITGVVRNGFIEGGQQVIRQPEVIVNRMR